MLKITTRPAEPEDAHRFVEIAARAFAGAPEYARPRDRPAFVAHTHGPANPAGRAWVSLAEDAGGFVGHVSAIPFRFLRRDGTTVVGMQIGCYVVDGSQQGRGVGHAILADLQRELSACDPHGFVYTYPNPRSIGRFLKLGGREVSRAKTRLVAPSRAGSQEVRAEDGAHWRVMSLDVSAARSALESMPDAAAAPGSFVRDRSFAHWRFLAEPAATRYRFAAAEREGGGERQLLFLAEHVAHGRSFTILVDAYPEASGLRLGTAVALARAAGGGRPVYLTTNQAWPRGPLSIALPRRFDPRPVVGILMPGREAIAPELAAAPIHTGDWMGF